MGGCLLVLFFALKMEKIPLLVLKILWEESKTVSREPEELHTKGLSDLNMSE